MSHLRVSSAGLLARVSGACFRQVCHEHNGRKLLTANHESLLLQTVRIAATTQFTQWRHLWNQAQITTRLHRTSVTVRLRTDSTKTKYSSSSGLCVHRIVWMLSGTTVRLYVTGLSLRHFSRLRISASWRS